MSGKLNIFVVVHYQVNEWEKHGCTPEISLDGLNSCGQQEYESQMGSKFLGENK